MVAGPAAADAISRARRLPTLRVGLHLTLVEGPSVLSLPALTGAQGQFPPNQAHLGFRYFFQPGIRPQLRREIRAQFAAFAATGLRLDHANAHKHMHLHPTIGRLLLQEGAAFALPAVRIPREPAWPGGSRLLAAWTRLLRAQCRRAGMRTNDWCFGLAWSGHMTTSRLLALAPRLPPGLTEIYFHPATRKDASLRHLMPDYEHEAELAALLDPAVRRAFAHCDLVGWT